MMKRIVGFMRKVPKIWNGITGSINIMLDIVKGNYVLVNYGRESVNLGIHTRVHKFQALNKASLLTL